MTAQATCCLLEGIPAPSIARVDVMAAVAWVLAVVDSCNTTVGAWVAG